MPRENENRKIAPKSHPEVPSVPGVKKDDVSKQMPSMPKGDPKPK